MLKREGESICSEPYTDMTKEMCTGLADNAKYTTYVESLEQGTEGVAESGQAPAYNGNYEFDKEETSHTTPSECYVIADSSRPMTIRWNNHAGSDNIPNAYHAKVCYAECPS